MKIISGKLNKKLVLSWMKNSFKILIVRQISKYLLTKMLWCSRLITDRLQKYVRLMHRVFKILSVRLLVRFRKKPRKGLAWGLILGLADWKSKIISLSGNLIMNFRKMLCFLSQHILVLILKKIIIIVQNII